MLARRRYGDLDGAVSFSARSIAALRALETQRGVDALISDPFAEIFAGPKAMCAPRPAPRTSRVRADLSISERRAGPRRPASSEPRNSRVTTRSGRGQ